MPVKKVKGGYKWGTTGKVYPTRKQAEAQGAGRTTPPTKLLSVSSINTGW